MWIKLNLFNLSCIPFNFKFKVSKLNLSHTEYEIIANYFAMRYAKMLNIKQISYRSNIKYKVMQSQIGSDTFRVNKCAKCEVKLSKKSMFIRCLYSLVCILTDTQCLSIYFIEVLQLI